MDHLVWDINPIFWDAGIFQIHWYGLFFAAAFVTGFVVARFIFSRYIKRKPVRNGLFLGMFLSMVFFSRFLLEFTKVRQESFSNGVSLNVGQLLSIPAILVGLILLYHYFRKKQTE